MQRTAAFSEPYSEQGYFFVSEQWTVIFSAHRVRTAGRHHRTRLRDGDERHRVRLLSYLYLSGQLWD